MSRTTPSRSWLGFRVVDFSGGSEPRAEGAPHSHSDAMGTPEASGHARYFFNNLQTIYGRPAHPVRSGAPLRA